MMIENKINYFAMHTNFDVAVMADIAADRLGLEEPNAAGKVRETESGLKGIGSSGTLDDELTLAELAALVRKAFDLPQVRCYGDPEMTVRKISMCPGIRKGDGCRCPEGGQSGVYYRRCGSSLRY